MVVLLVGALLLTAAAHASAGSPQSTSFVIQVYSDGSSLLTQKLAVPSASASVEIPLLSEVLSNVVATDQNGSPLSFKISGSNITVYTLGATQVTLIYDTQSLTNKTGTVWSLIFVTSYNTTVILPKYSTLSYVSGTTYSLSVQEGSPTVTIAPGAWKLSYGVSAGTGGPGGTTTQGGGPFGIVIEIGSGASLLVVLVAVGAGGFLAFRWWRGRLDLGAQGKDLRQDDVQVLGFIREKGGKVLEPEIRTRFALPKTSAWRQIKRLERMGFVKVTKIGSQNQIELLKNGEPGA